LSELQASKPASGPEPVPEKPDRPQPALNPLAGGTELKNPLVTEPLSIGKMVDEFRGGKKTYNDLLEFSKLVLNQTLGG